MAKKNKKAEVARCTECYSRIYFQKYPEIGFSVTCNECGTRLEVISLYPIELDWAYDHYEFSNSDYDYDDYEH